MHGGFRSLCLVSALIVSTLFHAPAFASEPHYNYYIVAGDDASSVARSLRRQQIRDDSGRPAIALTRWRLTVNYSTRLDHGQCHIERYHVDLQADISLPQWQPTANSSKALQRDWTRFVNALRTHELRHLQSGRSARDALHLALGELPAYRQCQQLDASVDQLLQSIVDKYKRIDQAIDRQSDHGAKDGAYFPG